MSSETAFGPSVRARGKRPLRLDDESQDEVSPVNERSRSPPREIQSSNKTLRYLLFKHGIELGAVGWISCVAAFITVVMAVVGFRATIAVSRASLAQAALANQMIFLKMCLDYSQLGTKDSNSGASNVSRHVVFDML